MEKINLEFFGPFPFANEEADILEKCEYKNESGIYLWAVRTNDNVYKVTYLGETKRSFYDRTKEHLLNQLSGAYPIYEPEIFMQGKEKMIWTGIWEKDKNKMLPELIKRYEELAHINARFIRLIELFVAPIKTEKNTLVKIEGAIANEIRKNESASVLLDKNIRYTFDKDKIENIKVIIKTSIVIEGFPKEIMI